MRRAGCHPDAGLCSTLPCVFQDRGELKVRQRITPQFPPFVARVIANVRLAGLEPSATDPTSPPPSDPPTPSLNPGADVLVVVEDVVGVVRGLHVHQLVVNGVAVRLADPVGVFVAAEEVDVDAFAETAEGGEEPPRPGGVRGAGVLAGG